MSIYIKRAGVVTRNDIGTGSAIVGASTFGDSWAHLTDAAAALSVFGLTGTATNFQTGTTYTTVLADAGRPVGMNNASANTLTIPTNASVAYPVQTILYVFQYGAGQTTIAAAGGVTIRSAGSKFKLANRYSVTSLLQIAANEWLMSGDLTT